MTDGTATSAVAATRRSARRGRARRAGGLAELPYILPVIAVFGIGQCLVYERTGSLFAVIAIHAAFNTVATLGVSPVPALIVGAMVLLGCLLVPPRLPAAPSPVLA